MSTHLLTRLAVLTLLVVTAGSAAWYFEGAQLRDLANNSKTASSVTVAPPVGLTATQLSQKAAALGRPIYWIGASATPTTYELTQAQNGDVFLRYLPQGVAVGSKSLYPAIGTYPMQNAYSVTAKLAAAAGTTTLKVPHAGIAFYRTDRPQNVFVAYPGASYQVELFDPSATAAHKLVQDGTVSDVVNEAVSTSGAHFVTPAQLTSYSKLLGQPVYWLGKEAGMKVELTRTSDGKVYVRYLPAGVPAGTRQPYLTVATYPMSNAYSVVRKLAGGSGLTAVKAAPTAVAVGSKTKPASVWVAFKQANYEVEVYDPAGPAKSLVAAGMVRSAS